MKKYIITGLLIAGGFGVGAMLMVQSNFSNGVCIAPKEDAVVDLYGTIITKMATNYQISFEMLSYPPGIKVTALVPIEKINEEFKEIACPR